MKRHFKVVLPIVLVIFAVACGGSSSLDNTEATVFLTVTLDTYAPDIDICLTSGFDVTIENMSINSVPVDPNNALTANQDVNLTRWVVTPVRTDGGTVASPVWSHNLLVHVPAGGSAQLSNYRVYPSEYFLEVPLSYLLPENGGYDPETGNINIRQSMNVQIFGRTVSGKAVATEVFPIAFNFTCGS